MDDGQTYFDSDDSIDSDSCVNTEQELAIAQEELDAAIKRADKAERVIKTLTREFRSDGSGMRSANYWRKRLSTLMNED